MKHSSRFYSALLWFLARTERLFANLRLHFVWRFIHRQYLMAPFPIKTRIHGREISVNPGNTYPITNRNYPLYNAPLVEIALQTAKEKAHKITIVDIGAAIGDTAVLLSAVLPSQIEKLWCIEGEQEFYSLLEKNTADLPQVALILAMLGEENGQAVNLVKIHPGTASAVGSQLVSTKSFDSITNDHQITPDLIKIDVDGFDGFVLSSAKETLKRHQPHIIFEWHPVLIENTKNLIKTAFDVLDQCGYHDLLWFHNTGEFSHFSKIPSDDEIQRWAKYLRQMQPSGAHFDIIAISSNTTLDPVAIANLDHFKNKVEIAKS